MEASGPDTALALRAPPEERVDLFAGEGAIRRLARSVDWSATPLGSPGTWPAGLRMAVRICLDSPSPVAIWAGPGFTLLYNEGYATVLGLKHPAAMGRPMREVWAEVADELRTEFEQVVRSGVGTRHENTPFRLRRGPREEEAFFTFTLTPIREADGRVSGLFNVTEETTGMERARATSEARYRLLFDSIDEALCIIEVIFDGDSAVDYRFLEVNPAFEEQTGLREAAGRTARELVPETEPHWYEVYGRVALTGEPVRFDLPARALKRHYDVYAFPVGAPEEHRVGVLFNDISPRKKAEEDLRQANLLYASLIDSVPDEIWMADPDGQVSLVNPRAREEFSLPIGERKSATQIVSSLEIHRGDGSPRPAEEAPLLRALRGEVLRNEDEIIRTPATGELRYRQVSATPVRDAEGHIVRAVAVARDVTEPRALQEQLQRNSRLAALGTLVAGVAHEINNPLSAALSSQGTAREVAEGLRGRLAAGEKPAPGEMADAFGILVESLQDAQDAGKRVATIVRDMARFSRPVEQTARVSLHQVVDQAMRWLPAAVGHAAKIAVAHAEVDDVLVNEGQLVQVVVNLVTNAAKSIPGGRRGTVTIRTGPGRPGMARLEVTDDGVGIPPSDLVRIFDPFYSTRRPGEGSGLGLAVSHAIVASLGGTIDATSEVGRGSTFRVELPVVDGKA